MRRSLIALSISAAAATAGCTDENPGFFIQNAVQISSQCDFTVSSAAISSGSLDLFATAADNEGRAAYTIPLVLQSRIVTRNQGTRSATRPDAGAITVQGAVIRILGGAPGTAEFEDELSTYTVAASGFVPSARDTTPGQGTLALQAIPAAEMQNLRALAAGGDRLSIVLGIQVYGTTSGGIAVETQEWYFPVDVCIGCLANREAAPDEPCLPGMNGEPY